MKIRILAIAPYLGLKDLLLEMVQNDESIQMDVEVADLQEAIPLVQYAEEQGYDIIVSRGGTAGIIRNHVSLPVVDIPVSGYDILRVLTLVKNANSKVAIIGFPNVCQGVSAISSLLDFDIPTYQIERGTEVANTLRTAFQSGVEIVLGDVVTVSAAQEMGYNGILITSGQESVQDMLEQVHRVYDVYKRKQASVDFYSKILDNDSRGIFVLDESHRVIYKNQTATRILEEKTEQSAQERFRPVMPALSRLIKQIGDKDRHPDLQPFHLIHNQKYKVEIKTVKSEVGQHYFVYLDSVENWRVEQRFAPYIPRRLATFNQLIGSSSTLKKAIARAKKFAKSDRNVWISGEKGTGKSLFAQSIHMESNRFDQNFYMFSCEELTEAKLDQLLLGTAQVPALLEMGFSGTIFLRNVDRMSRPVQERWLQIVKSYSSVRFIASSSIPISRLENKTDFHQELAHELGELHISIPPLRERLEDIGEIVRVTIAEYNSQTGKQIVGVREAVLEQLESCTWPRNLLDLENVMQEMLLLTKGSYVEKEETAEVLERYLKMSGNLGYATGSAQIDLSGSLEEIEQRILWYVLQEEGMNQSKTCKRLKINRSTLWRKMSKMLNNETQ